MTVKSTCRSCHAPILWAITDNGRRMPVDVGQVDGGNVLLTQGPDGGHLATVIKADGRRAWTSHFATCPQAAWHRGKGNA